MPEDINLWLTLAVGVVFTVAAAALQHSFQSGSPAQKFFRAAKFILIGLGCLFVLWLGIDRFRSKGPTDPKASQAVAPKQEENPAHQLVARLSQRRWALQGESCERDAVRFGLEGNELVAYFQGADAFRYELVSASGQRLTTRRNDRLVTFEAHADGFTYNDGGHEGWYRLCG